MSFNTKWNLLYQSIKWWCFAQWWVWHNVIKAVSKSIPQDKHTYSLYFSLWLTLNPITRTEASHYLQVCDQSWRSRKTSLQFSPNGAILNPGLQRLFWFFAKFKLHLLICVFVYMWCPCWGRGTMLCSQISCTMLVPGIQFSLSGLAENSWPAEPILSTNLVSVAFNSKGAKNFIWKNFFQFV